MTDAFNLFFVKLAPLLLTDLLNQFEWCVLQDNDQLARSASSCLETLVNMPYEFDFFAQFQNTRVLCKTPIYVLCQRKD